MTRRVIALAGAALLAVACGGGGSSPTNPAPTPTPSSSAVVVLDSGSFDSLVLAAPKPSVVEFHSPT